ncbi:MAG: sortase [Clostridia bacterium]|nr:sortase [Clostridia bacterium]
MTGKRYEKNSKGFNWERINHKKVYITVGIVLIIFIIIISLCFKKDKNKKVEEQETSSSEVYNSKIPEKFEGYDVLGELTIEKINLKNYILDSTETSAMDKAPIKLYGNTLNQEGNFCIAGHNYDEIFARLKDLEVGDEFYIEDIEGIIQDYKITEILEIEPTDLTPLMPVKDKIEVTLITCEDGATERLVLKAERIDIEEIEE